MSRRLLHIASATEHALLHVVAEAHLEGEHFQLEPFIVVGIIADVRHILSIVVSLALPETATVNRDRLVELDVDAGAAFVLVAGLALARWSQGRSTPRPDPDITTPSGE
ncbi:MAG TPA: hypothetical protein VLJ59_19235 [Mycobacteriales bacterium]|nr:hypothetical protein [Mycobacteriales bacterium]